MNSKHITYQLPVNWEKGMMINKTHLDDLNNHILSTYRNALLSGINSSNYGILPDYNEGFESLKIDLELEGNQYIIKLSDCKVFTYDGFCFDINPNSIKKGLFGETNFEIPVNEDKLNSNYLLVYLYYDIENLVNVGKEDLDRDSYNRKPFKNLNLKFKVDKIEEIADVEKLEGQDKVFPLAIINTLNKNLTIDQDYIPPCVNLYSNRRLAYFHNQLKNYNKELSKNLPKVLMMIRERLRGKIGSSTILDLDFIVTNLLMALSEINTAFITDIRNNSPLKLFSLYKKMANVFIMSYHSIDQRKRFEVDDFFSITNRKNLDQVAQNLINARYKHINIYSNCISPTIGFVEYLNGIFEYHGSKGLDKVKFGEPAKRYEDTNQKIPDNIMEKDSNDKKSNNEGDLLDILRS